MLTRAGSEDKSTQTFESRMNEGRGEGAVEQEGDDVTATTPLRGRKGNNRPPLVNSPCSVVLHKISLPSLEASDFEILFDSWFFKHLLFEKFLSLSKLPNFYRLHSSIIPKNTWNLFHLPRKRFHMAIKVTPPFCYLFNAQNEHIVKRRVLFLSRVENLPMNIGNFWK